MIVKLYRHTGTGMVVMVDENHKLEDDEFFLSEMHLWEYVHDTYLPEDLGEED